MSLMRRLTVLSFVAAFGLAVPNPALAGHHHSRNCGHHYNDGYRGYGSHGHGYSYAPHHSYRHGYAAPYYRGSYGYSYGGYGYGAPYYDSGYYGGYSYAPPPPPPRCYRRPRVSVTLGF